MHVRLSRSVVVLGLFLLIAKVSMTAEDAKEVALPKLPKGAGKVDKDAAKTFTTTDSGLKYRILRKRTGGMPKATDYVKVNYHGWLDGGKVFDSSYKRREPISGPVSIKRNTPNNIDFFRKPVVIKGWTEGMQLVGEGGMIELEIPANLGLGDLGYGDRGSPGAIPPEATLHFLVELLKVE